MTNKDTYILQYIDKEWKRLYPTPFSYWQAEMLLDYYGKTSSMKFKTETVEVAKHKLER